MAATDLVQESQIDDLVAAVAAAITALGGGGGGTDPEVVRDTIFAALQPDSANPGVIISQDDPGDIIKLGWDRDGENNIHTGVSYLRAKIGGNGMDSFGFLNGSAVGTATAAQLSITSRHTRTPRTDYLVTVAATSAIALYRLAAASMVRGNAAGVGGFYYSTEFGPATGCANASARLFAGLVSNVAAPTDADPSVQAMALIGVGYDSADSTLQIMHNDGSGTPATKVNLGASFPQPTADRSVWYRLEIWCDPNGANFKWRVTNLSTTTPVVAEGTISTDMPSTTTYLNPRWYHSVGGVSSVVGLALGGCYLRQKEMSLA